MRGPLWARYTFYSLHILCFTIICRTRLGGRARERAARRKQSHFVGRERREKKEGKRKQKKEGKERRGKGNESQNVQLFNEKDSDSGEKVDFKYTLTKDDILV